MAELCIPIESEGARVATIIKTGQFPWREFQNPFLSGEKPVIDGKLGALFGDLQSGRYWGPISMINGNYNPTDPEGSDTHEKRLEKQAWAEDTFTPTQLQEIVQLCVDSAFTRRKEQVGWPARTRPHSTLYTALVENPDSMFGDMLTPEFIKRLQNGRFWEEAGVQTFSRYGFASRTVNDVLKNHYDDLEVSFAPIGIDLFADNQSGSSDLAGLTNSNVRRYGQFISRINDQKDELGLTDHQLAPVVKPYVLSFFSSVTVHDMPQPRFKPEQVQLGLAQPMIQEFLAKSPEIKLAFEQQIARDLFATGEMQPFQKNAMISLLSVPNPEHTLTSILLAQGRNIGHLQYLKRMADIHEIDLNSAIDPTLEKLAHYSYTKH